MEQNGSRGNGRFVRLAVLLTLLLAAALIACVWMYVTQRPEKTYQQARDHAFAAAYEDMQAQLDWLRDNAEEELYYAAVLEGAEIADYNGDYDAALDILSQPVENESEAYQTFAGQADALAQECTYHKALKLYEEGEYAKSARMAAQVRQYEPALSLYQVAQSAYEATLPTPTPSPTPAPTPAPTPTPTPTPAPTPTAAAAAVTQTAQPTATPSPTPTPTPTPTPRPTLMPEGRVAAGRDHTVVLREDGTVAAYGDNTYGQLDVSGWQNVTFVAAGARHTLGLTADGRVLACGDNTHQQTDVSLFSGVKAIAAGDYDSFLLLHSGEVIASGYHEYPFLQEVLGADAIWAGSYGLIVHDQTGMRASHASLALDAALTACAVSRGYAVGIDDQGGLHSTTALVPAWENVQRVSGGENAVLALTADGEVLAHGFDQHSQADFTFAQPVLALSAGANHYAFLLADGSLEIRYADGASEHYDHP